MRYAQDSALIQRLLDKDDQAFRTLLSSYEKIVFHFVSRQMKDKSEVEEIVQEVFIAFIEGLRHFRGESSIKTYLCTIARNKVVDAIRKKKIKKILFSTLPPRFVEGLKTILLDDEIDRKELEAKIQGVLHALPNDYQIVLRLKYIDGVSVNEIAHTLSLNFKATESLLFRARKAFVVAYKKE